MAGIWGERAALATDLDPPEAPCRSIVAVMCQPTHSNMNDIDVRHEFLQLASLGDDFDNPSIASSVAFPLGSDRHLGPRYRTRRARMATIQGVISNIDQ
ncbi:hypothetical protein [Halomonas icarae]|uniref:Uncharacterized protein n=1 Tax=Halomonas icarae TaxID=2691040 RepID=A0A7X4W1Z0_9GAMM|nr:hypothetical protein [Halomonas icarae]MDR5903424.1 hypothetical protein [Halomonas icarae]NAW14322.1 hypothetical protein [Halomonas icarae]